MLNRRQLGAATLIAVLAFTTSVHASQTRAFDPKAFEAAQKAGRPILVDITASWCPTCKAQKPLLEEMAAKPKFKDLVVFEVDFDSQKDVVRRFKAQSQSTLITFKGQKEVGRSVGDTRRESIEDLLNKAI